MKTQLMILALSLVFMGFLGCYEEQKEPVTITINPTKDSIMLDSLQNMNIHDLLDSLMEIEAVPMTHF